MKNKIKDEISDIIFGVDKIANTLNLTERRVQQLAKQGIISKNEKGKYELLTTVKNYIRYLQDLSLGKKLGMEDIHTQKVRLFKAQADKTEIEVEILEGALIPNEVVEEVWGRMISAFRARVITIPSKYAPLITGIKSIEESKILLIEAVNDALSELSEYDENSYTNRTNSKKGSKARKSTAKAKS